MSASPDLPQKGDLIAEKYLVEDILGAGGMGVVVAARHITLRQLVAVKFLLPSAARVPEASARFLREARAVVAIQSEHVARVLDHGTLANGAPFMVMEHLAGTDLAHLIQQRRQLPVAEAVDYILQAGEAIAEAHALGIVHRDLKPGNLFLTARSEGSPLIKVLDFGLSKMTDEDPSGGTLTATGVVVGSPYYMSPEHLRSLKHVDTRGDIWALGVILYELLAGKRPFDGQGLTAVCTSIVAETPRPIGTIRRDVPEALDAVIFGCLEKRVERRTQSMAELARGLAPFTAPESMRSVERIVRFSARASGGSLSQHVSGPHLGMGSAGGPVPLSGLTPAEPTTLPVAAPGQPSPEGTTVRVSAWGQSKPLRRATPIAAIVGAIVAMLVGLGALAWEVSVRQKRDEAALSVATSASAVAVQEPSAAPSSTAAPVEVTEEEAVSEAPVDTAVEAASAAPAASSARVEAAPAQSGAQPASSAQGAKSSEGKSKAPAAGKKKPSIFEVPYVPGQRKGGYDPKEVF